MRWPGFRTFPRLCCNITHFEAEMAKAWAETGARSAAGTQPPELECRLDRRPHRASCWAEYPPHLHLTWCKDALICELTPGLSSSHQIYSLHLLAKSHALLSALFSSTRSYFWNPDTLAASLRSQDASPCLFWHLESTFQPTDIMTWTRFCFQKWVEQHDFKHYEKPVEHSRTIFIYKTIQNFLFFWDLGYDIYFFKLKHFKNVCR